MALLLPLLAFLLMTQLPFRPRRGAIELSWSTRAVLGLVVWGLISVAITEGLSLLGTLRPVPTALAWMGVVTVLAGFLFRSRRKVVLPGIGAALRSLSRVERFLAGGLVAQAIALLVVALASPPNNVDSLLYHMARVVHWAQQGSLRFFPTAYAHQLFMPPWAETILLHLRLLAGDDRLANLVQWISYVGVCLGALSLARELGAARSGQFVAAAFAASIPMAVLQATSTQNDLVVSLWLIILAHVVLWSRTDDSTRPAWEAGAAWALGLLTKATFYIYSLPLLLWMFAPLVRRGRFPRALALGVAALLIGILVNLGHWSRTAQAYGNPLGPADAVQSQLSFTSGPTLALRAELQMLGRNLVTPLGPLNRALKGILHRTSWALGPDFAEEMQAALWNHEDTAGNPLHLLLAIGALVWTLLRGREEDRSAKSLAGAALAGYWLLPVVFPTSSTLVGLRFQLPFLVLAAPLVGRAAGAWLSDRAAYAAAGLALLFAVPWVLFNNTRPLIGIPPRVTRTQSVLIAPAEVTLFAMYPGRLDEYRAVADRIREAKCTSIGLKIDSHDPEYLFWWLLEAPQSGRRLESVEPPPPLIRYEDPGFQPCAVICTICESESEYLGLPLDRPYRGARLFMQESPSQP